MTLPPFARRLTGEGSLVGAGEIGGKAAGLLRASSVLASRFPDGRFGPFRVGIPPWTVLGTELYAELVERHGLDARAEEDDEAVARAFAAASFSPLAAGDLWALVAAQHTPLAVRSSSLLEDRLLHPLAGVYLTKMTPNDQSDPAARFARLVEAVKLVWASSLFPSARAARAASRAGAEERMAVVLQETVGRRHGARFYPDLSGVARSVAFYRFGGAAPEEGVAQLALGLGKTIVDGGASWRFVPSRPAAPPPFSSAAEKLDAGQRTFWAVRMGEPPEPDPLREAEFLVSAGLRDAEEDGTLAWAASTWDARRERFTPGPAGDGPRALDFAPLLLHGALPLAALVRELLAACEDALGQPVEIEFAAAFPPREAPFFALVQLRPLRVVSEPVEVHDALPGRRLLVSSRRVLGNGSHAGARDVVYVRRDADAARLREAAAELARHDRALRAEGRPYVLVVAGRLGTSDPWLGVPARWSDVSGAIAIVEAPIPGRPVETSEGAHVFHNLAAAGVPYFSLGPEGLLDWSALESRPPAGETPMVRRVRFEAPLVVEVDGRSGRGAIFAPEEP